jgi:hypothetical protein
MKQCLAVWLYETVSKCDCMKLCQTQFRFYELLSQFVSVLILSIFQLVSVLVQSVSSETQILQNPVSVHKTET